MNAKDTVVGTAKKLDAEIVGDGGARSTDPFDPTRLRPLDPSLLRLR